MNDKDLTQMTLEELWQLFPISLVAPRPEWQTNYIEMETRLRGLLTNYPVVRISHIGSTAIPGIWAKDIVDILVEFATGECADTALTSDAHHVGRWQAVGAERDAAAGTETILASAAAVLEQVGFLVMSSGDARIALNLGYTPEGYADKVYHIHLRYAGDNDELYFRDYLCDHPDVAREYETRKLALWHPYEHDRDGYTAAKTAFVQQWTAAARAAYPGRYDVRWDSMVAHDI